MPDLITHVSLAHILIRGFHAFKRTSLKFHAPEIWLFYMGTMLPDLLTRPVYILFPAAKHWTVFLHTPLAMLMVTLILTLCFEERTRARVFSYLASGALIHFLADALQKQVIGNNFWFFPFSWHNFSLNLIWAHEFMVVLPVVLGSIVFMEAMIYLKQRTGKDAKRQKK